LSSVRSNGDVRIYCHSNRDGYGYGHKYGNNYSDSYDYKYRHGYMDGYGDSVCVSYGPGEWRKLGVSSGSVNRS
jgi:hypothetical protein